MLENVRSLDRAYGDGDPTYQACGGEKGIRQLVEAFYGVMDSLSAARRIRALHPADLQLSIDELVCMEQALAQQPFRDDLKRYLLEQLFVPAERIRRVVQPRLAERAR
jgi:hemoglobin